MTTLDIQATKETPSVFYNTDTFTLEIEGRSYPENSKAFYEPVVDFVNSLNPSYAYTFRFKMDYFNSSSSKMILDLMLEMKKLIEYNKATQIEWFYGEDDEDMIDAGNEYEELLQIPIQKIERVLA